MKTEAEHGHLYLRYRLKGKPESWLTVQLAKAEKRARGWEWAVGGAFQYAPGEAPRAAFKPVIPMGQAKTFTAAYAAALKAALEYAKEMGK